MADSRADSLSKGGGPVAAEVGELLRARPKYDRAHTMRRAARERIHSYSVRFILVELPYMNMSQQGNDPLN